MTLFCLHFHQLLKVIRHAKIYHHVAWSVIFYFIGFTKRYVIKQLPDSQSKNDYLLKNRLNRGRNTLNMQNVVESAHFQIKFKKVSKTRYSLKMSFIVTTNINFIIDNLYFYETIFETVKKTVYFTPVILAISTPITR